jgi:hypothetical protein
MVGIYYHVVVNSFAVGICYHVVVNSFAVGICYHVVVNSFAVGIYIYGWNILSCCRVEVISSSCHKVVLFFEFGCFDSPRGELDSRTRLNLSIPPKQ